MPTIKVNKIGRPNLIFHLWNKQYQTIVWLHMLYGILTSSRLFLQPTIYDCESKNNIVVTFLIARLNRRAKKCGDRVMVQATFLIIVLITAVSWLQSASPAGILASFFSVFLIKVWKKCWCNNSLGIRINKFFLTWYFPFLCLLML